MKTSTINIPKVTKKWTQKNGKKIRICDMTDSHLVNTIRMLDRVEDSSYERALSNAYGALAFMRGEMAIASIESEIQHMEEDWDGDIEAPHHPLYNDLMLEVERRGLKLTDA